MSKLQPGAQTWTAGDVLDLANVFAERDRLRAALEQAEAERDEAYRVVTEDAEGTGASLVQAATWLRDRARRFEAERDRLQAALAAAVYVGGDHIERAIDEALDASLKGPDHE